MQKIENVLNSLRNYSKNNNRVEKLFKNLYNPEFYKLAYSNIYSKPGNMTKASDNSTIDGMSMDRINKLIESLRDGSYKPTNLRRVNISKQNNNNKTRPISIPSFNDKLIQEIIRILLNELYESSFSDHSHGFRPNRSCHSALHEVYLKFQGTVWWIDADIKGCFDNINHEILLNILKEKIRDNKFIHLINLFLKSGYIENHQYHKTYSGTPQGSIISPILCNIYLDKFDKFMEYCIKNYNTNLERKRNLEYRRIDSKLVYLRKKNDLKQENLSEYQKQYKKLKQERNKLFVYDSFDPDFRRLSYIRYADDFLIGIIGPKQDALNFKDGIKKVLENKLKLELSEEKTKILHKDDKVRFLGYDINIIQNCQIKTNNGHINLSVPYDIMVKFILNHRTGKWWNSPISKKTELKAIHRTELINLDVLEIARTYNAQIKGLYEYYKLANNVYKLGNFNYIHITSYMRTLAAKFKTSRFKLYKNNNYFNGKDVGCKYKLKDGTEKFQVIFNGPFEKQNYFKKSDMCNDNIGNVWKYSCKTSLIKRMEADQCEYCKTTTGPFEVHHVKHLKDIKSGKANWEKLMISRQRKTLVLCRSCHHKLHSGNL
jgi:group II intron reverse transcriptase/maturase